MQKCRLISGLVKQRPNIPNLAAIPSTLIRLNPGFLQQIKWINYNARNDKIRFLGTENLIDFIVETINRAGLNY